MKKFLAFTGLVAVAGSLGFVLVGCNSESAVSLGSPPAQTKSTTGSDVTGTVGTLPTSSSFEVWFARGQRLVPELRTHAATRRVATAALEALLAGPTRAERASGVATEIPAGTRRLGIAITGGVATVDLTSVYSGGSSLSMKVRLGQVVYTLTQFPTIKAIRFELDGTPVNVFSSAGIVLGHPVSRSDYRDLVPEVEVAEPLTGSWRRLPAAPIATDEGRLASVWTGGQMLVFGRRRLTPLKSVNVAAAYDTGANSWRRLAPPQGPAGSYEGRYSAVWTGKEMLVWGPFTTEAFDPATNRWRQLPRSPTGRPAGLVVWTGRELIGWGGGCCGDAFADGAAYSPSSNSWRRLARSPLFGGQSPTGAWTGRELIVFGVRKPEGPALRSAAAYNPKTDTWRRIAPLPEPRYGANAVWDGRELLVVGGTSTRATLPAAGFAYDPATNRWRRLPSMGSGRIGAAAVWAGKRLLLWGGQTGPPPNYVIPPHGLAFDPKANRWSPLSQAPLVGRPGPTAVWTGRALIVWGGENGLADGAAFTPAG